MTKNNKTENQQKSLNYHLLFVNMKDGTTIKHTATVFNDMVIYFAHSSFYKNKCSELY